MIRALSNISTFNRESFLASSSIFMRLLRQKRASILIHGCMSGEMIRASLTKAIAFVASIYLAASGSL
jgi:hypothetical protein